MLPPGAKRMASSSTAQYEIWTLRDNVIAVQGHPEMAVKTAIDTILPSKISSGCEDAISDKMLLGVCMHLGSCMHPL